MANQVPVTFAMGGASQNSKLSAMCVHLEALGNSGTTRVTSAHPILTNCAKWWDVVMRGGPKMTARVARSVQIICPQIIRFAIVAALLQFTTPAHAATARNDEGLWLMFAGQGALGPKDGDLGKFRWWLDIQPRFTDDADGLGQTLIRPGLGFSLSDNATAWAGYAWIRTKRPGRGQSKEHRIWQQFSWTTNISSLKLSTRTRLEQRLLDTGNDTGWRFRQFVKATLPIAGDGRLYLSTYDEIFVDLNGTDWGQHTGVSQNRFFVGPGWNFRAQPFGSRLRTEIGYLNQFIRRRANTDRINHILSINLFVNF